MTPQENAGTPPLVLVVDDYTDSREMCAEYLAVSGFRVDQAADGTEALNRIAACLPDVVLMDLSLPDIDGLEVTRRLKKDSRTAAVRVIALTGHGGDEHAGRARAAGCASFLLKPCHPDAMVDEIRRVLASSETHA